MQRNVWEKEYTNPKLVTGASVPQASVKKFLRFLRHERCLSPESEKRGVALENICVLDLGCGTGKNTHYIASLDRGNRVIGIDISETAFRQARVARDGLVAEGILEKNQVEYIHANIGEPLKLSDDSNNNTHNADGSFDLALDVTSSNSLTEKERAVHIAEVHRLLKPGGWFFIRALCKDGDKNAQVLLKLHPGPEKDTYIMPELGLVERVFSKENFMETYSAFFEIIELKKETHYSQFAGRSYKRNFWVAYARKHTEKNQPGK